MVRRISIIILCFIFIAPVNLQANPSVDVPVRHWSYDYIEKLAILGLSDIADIGIRPVSRIKMAYMVKSAIDKTSSYELDFEWEEQEYLETLLYDLIEEFREELVTIGINIASVRDDGPKKYIFNKPELNIEKVYANLGSNEALFENKEGWKLKDEFNIRIKLNSWAKIANLFAVSLTPGLKYSKDDVDVDFEDVHIRFAHPKRNMELAIGRSSMWWGPGFYGSLLLTDNAFPLDAARFNNIYPFRLPWVFRKIGRFNGQFFVSRLEEKRAIANPWLCGWKLDYTPWDFLKFGFGHMLMFGGKGVKKLGFANFWSSASLVFSAAGGGTETENHIISADMQLFIRRIDRFLPIATGAKLYTEWGAEDEAGNVPIDLASVTGAYITDVFKIPGFDVKVEFAKFSKVWYTHFKYASGYTRRGKIIGYDIGGDSDAFTIEAIFNFLKGYKMTTLFSHQRRGLNETNIETVDKLSLKFSALDSLKMYNIYDINVEVFYEFENIENYNNTIDKAKNHIFGVEATRKF